MNLYKEVYEYKYNTTTQSWQKENQYQTKWS